MTQCDLRYSLQDSVVCEVEYLLNVLRDCHLSRYFTDFDLNLFYLCLFLVFETTLLLNLG